MSLLEITNLTHSFLDKVLYENSSFSLNKGEHVGVIGQNGVGKSTLIKIIAGSIYADVGEIKWAKNIKIGYLDQHANIDKNITIEEYLKTAFKNLYEIENKMLKYYEEAAVLNDEKLFDSASEYQDYLVKNDFYLIDKKIDIISDALGISAIGLNKQIKELSGGQRAKIIIAKLLLEKNDVLIMDEPTNFFDKEHILWLEDYLKNYEGAFIIVSHDYDFLDKISNRICNIEFKSIKKYNGKYRDFIKQMENYKKDYLRSYEKEQKKIEKMEEYIRKNIAGVNSSIAKGRRKQLERMPRMDSPKFIRQKINIEFKEVKVHNTKTLCVNDLSVGYSKPILPKLNFSMQVHEKLVITGYNGIGKSTLLKTLTNKIQPLSGSFSFAQKTIIGYYEQDINWPDNTLTPLDIIAREYKLLTSKEIRKHLAHCGLKNDSVLQQVKTLSGGEQAKVKLCRLILSPCNFLILDEITNHFDIESKEVIKEALIKFSGNIILVSHEESFYNKLANNCLNIEVCKKLAIS